MANNTKASKDVQKPRARRRNEYTLQERESALLAMVLHGGSPTHAHEYLAAQGLYIPVVTLQWWKREHHAGRYEEIRVEVAPKVAAKIASEAEEIALQLAEAERLAVKRQIEVLPTLERRDVSQAVKDLAISKGIQIDKSGALRGRPGVIIEQRSPAHVLGSIAKKLGWVEGSAEEINGEQKLVEGEK